MLGGRYVHPATIIACGNARIGTTSRSYDRVEGDGLGVLGRVEEEHDVLT